MSNSTSVQLSDLIHSTLKFKSLLNLKLFIQPRICLAIRMRTKTELWEKYYALKYLTFFITDTNGCAESSRACQNATKLCKYNLLASIDFLKLSAFGINLKFIASELVAGSHAND